MKRSLEDCKKWLESRGVYDLFVKNLKEFKDESIEEWYDKCEENYEFFIHAFPFADTDEGFMFWNDMKNDFLGL